LCSFAYITAIEPIATGFATVMIQNRVNTGYFKKSDGSRMDTDPKYMRRVQNSNYIGTKIILNC